MLVISKGLLKFVHNNSPAGWFYIKNAFNKWIRMESVNCQKNRNNGLSDFTFWSDSKFWDHQRLQKASSRLKKQHRCLIQGVKEDNQLNQQKLLLLPPSSDFPNNPPSTQTLIFFFHYLKIAIATNSREKKSFIKWWISSGSQVSIILIFVRSIFLEFNQSVVSVGDSEKWPFVWFCQSWLPLLED